MSKTLVRTRYKADARGHIDRSASIDDRLRHHGWFVTDTGCWEWAGGTFHKFGYGQLRMRNGMDAHRAAYEAWVGEIPQGMQVRHTCDNPPCINPEHLELGTSQDNHDDMVTRGRALTGSRNPRAKLTPAEVSDIKLFYALGASQGNIGKSFGVGQPQVSLIVRGKSWKEVV